MFKVHFRKHFFFCMDLNVEDVFKYPFSYADKYGGDPGKKRVEYLADESDYAASDNVVTFGTKECLEDKFKEQKDECRDGCFYSKPEIKIINAPVFPERA